MRPFALGAAPAEGQFAIQPVAPALRVIARHGQIGQQAHVHEQDTAREIREDREHVPDQRRVKIRPQLPRVRIRDQPVEFPGTAQVHQREHRRGQQREERQCFGDTADGPPPLDLHHPQRRRDEGAGMADPDEIDKVRDIQRPFHRPIKPRNADAPVHLNSPCHEPGQDQRAQHNHQHPEFAPGAIHRFEDIFVHVPR